MKNLIKKLYEKFLRTFGGVYRVYYFNAGHSRSIAVVLAMNPRHALRLVKRYTGFKPYAVLEEKKDEK